MPVLLVWNPGSRSYRRVHLAAGRDTALRAAARAAAFVAPDVPMSVLHAYEGQFESALVLHGVGGSGGLCPTEGGDGASPPSTRKAW